MEGREGEREGGREVEGQNEDYMKGAEAGRRERWRKKGEMRENKTTLDSRKLMMSHTT